MSRPFTIHTNSEKSTSVIISVFLIVFCILTICYQILDIHNSRNVLWRLSNSGLNRSNVHIVIVCMIGVSGIFFVVGHSAIVFKYPVVKIALLLFLWSTMRDLLTMENVWLLAVHSGLALMWIFVFNIGYSVGKCKNAFPLIVLSVFFQISFCIMVYAFRLSFQMRAMTVGSPGVFNLAYSLLVYAPFFFLFYTHRINKLLLVLLVLLVFVSLKRGAIICLPLMVIGYLFFSNEYAQYKKQTKVVILLLVCSILFACVYFIDSKMNGGLSQRFSAKELQDGSGRATQYSHAISIWLDDMRLEQKIFGMGASSFQKKLGIAIHNEILAWLCYYGLLGACMFLSFLYACYMRHKKLYALASPYTAVHLTILVYFGVTSLVSGFYFMHTALFLFLTLGLVYGLEEKRLAMNSQCFLQKT